MGEREGEIGGGERESVEQEVVIYIMDSSFDSCRHYKVCCVQEHANKNQRAMALYIMLLEAVL